MTADIIHRSKIGLGILIPAALVLGTVTGVMVVNTIWIGLVICLIIDLLVIYHYTGTYYRITPEKQLLIRCGILGTVDIDISDIEWIKRTNDLTSAPALSADRLEIGYKGGTVIISPKDRKKFVEDLRKINSKIWWTN